MTFKGPPARSIKTNITVIVGLMAVNKAIDRRCSDGYGNYLSRAYCNRQKRSRATMCKDWPLYPYCHERSALEIMN